MNFLNPFFLIGLISVAVPVVIHLINLRRPQKISFSTLSFFNELQKSTLRRIRIKQYLLLAIRTAAVLFLALALARPFLPPSLGGISSSERDANIILMIDNSPSMSRVGSEGPFLDQAKSIARHIVQNASEQTGFIVMSTNNPSGNQILVGERRAGELIDEIEISNTGNFISDRLHLLSERLVQLPSRGNIIYLITDGQQSQLEPLKGLNPGKMEKVNEQLAIQPVILGSIAQSNVAVSDIQLNTQMLGKGNPVTLQVEVNNYGTSVAANHFISVETGSRMIGQYEVTLDPGETRELLFELTPEEAGDLAGKVVIEGDEVTFDNERYFVINVPQIRNVLLVNEDESAPSDFVSYLKPALEAAKQSNTQIQFTEVQPESVDQSTWLANDVIILDGLAEIPEYWFSDLQNFVQEGSGILFLPSEKGDVRNYNRFLELFNAGRFRDIRGEYGSFNPVARLGPLTEGHPVLDDLFQKEEDETISIDEPELFFYYQYIPASNAGSFTILRSDIGDDILAEQKFGEGTLLVSAMGADPGWSNFPVNTLFAPVFYRTVLYASMSEEGGLTERILGRDFTWNGNVQSRDVELVLNDVTYKPEVQGTPEGIRVQYAGKEWEPGILKINAGNTTNLVAVNQDIMESDFETLTSETLDNVLNNMLTVNNAIEVDNLTDNSLDEKLATASFGREIWNWFIWIALLLLVAESLLSRLYKAESLSK